MTTPARPRYGVLFRPSARKSLLKLPDGIQDRLIKSATELGEQPRPPGCVKLSDSEAWRIRVGDYRIIYEIHDDRLIVLVVRIGNRKDVYR